jgi:hypothetical protein
MSTRCSILYKGEPTDPQALHLFEDCLERYEDAGLHLDITPIAPKCPGQYGDFSFDAPCDVHLRIPHEVCEAIANWVIERRERIKKAAEARHE